MPEDLPEDLERPVLLGYFYLGKLYREVITADRDAQITNLTASIDAYQVSFYDITLKTKLFKYYKFYIKSITNSNFVKYSEYAKKKKI
jgi:hypothetical protein